MQLYGIGMLFAVLQKIFVRIELMSFCANLPVGSHEFVKVQSIRMGGRHLISFQDVVHFDGKVLANNVQCSIPFIDIIAVADTCTSTTTHRRNIDDKVLQEGGNAIFAVKLSEPRNFGRRRFGVEFGEGKESSSTSTAYAGSMEQLEWEFHRHKAAAV